MTTVTRPRPYIPVAIKLRVAELQLAALGVGYVRCGVPDGVMLRVVLGLLGLENPHLDHRPPLALREFDERTQRYIPDANDPNYLQWIEGATDHHELTHGRGGEKMRFGGDLREIRKTKRLESVRLGKRSRKRKSRPLPKGRKLKSRGWLGGRNK